MKGLLKRINCRFSINLRIVVAVFACAAFLAAQSGGIVTKDPKSKEAMDAALMALGGADNINGIKSLIIKGVKTSSDSTFGSTTSEVEMRMLLPDNFQTIARYTSGQVIYSGISQGKLFPQIKLAGIQNGEFEQMSPKVAKLLADTTEESLNHIKDEWSYFLLGTHMKAGPTPLTLSYDSKSGKFSLTKKDGGFGEIEFDSKTGYPSVVRYENVYLSGDTQKYEKRFQDHFSVNGIMFPRIITAIVQVGGQRGSSTFRIEEVQINPKLSPKDFESTR